MPDYADAGHRPHADYKGQTPDYKITEGPTSIKVTLDQWGPQDPFRDMWRYLQSNWGEHPAEFPSGTVAREGAIDYVESCFAGRTLQQVLEGVTFWFTIDGVTRAMTHEMVRARFAAFMQHGGRDNDWRHRDWTMPETLRRAITEFDEGGRKLNGRASCIVNSKPLQQLVDQDETALQLHDVIENHVAEGKRIYAALVDAGIPWQDARRLLPIGTQTYIHGIYNFVSLRDFLGNRMEFIMDWEINCVAQLMYREVLMHCPPVIGKYLGSHSDRQRRAAFAGLDSWPPDEKYEPTVDQSRLPRQHRSSQMPFWVLAQSSLDGGPVKWIPTNGTYPHDHPDAPKPRG